jgi:hypothetical protein
LVGVEVLKVLGQERDVGQIAGALTGDARVVVYRQDVTGTPGALERVTGSEGLKPAGTSWSLSDSGLVNGRTYVYTAYVEDAAGNRSAIASSAVFTVATGAPVYSVALSPAAHNTGAGRKVSTTFTGTIVWDGDFDAVQGKSITPIPSTAVDAQGNCTLTGLTQTGPALLLRKWADGARSAELVNVV